MLQSKWAKIGLGIAIVLIFIVGLVMYRSLKSEKNVVEKQAQDLLNRNGEFSAQSSEAQIAELKEAMLYLAKELGTVQKNDTQTDSGSFDRVVSPNITGSLSGSVSSADLLLRLRSLEEKVLVLESKSGVTAASSSLPLSTSTSTKNPIQYITLGAGAELTDRNGIALPEFEVTLDPADFPGYVNMVLESNVRMSESVGTLSLNLYNATDKVSITNSDISTNSTSSIATASFNFRLATGRKTYRIWAKSSEGYLSYINSARLKITY